MTTTLDPPTTSAPHPPAPHTLEAAGVSFDLALRLVAKTLYFAGELTGTQLANRLGLQYRVIEPCLDFLKRERHCDITGGGLLGGPAYVYRLSDAGRSRAAMYIEQNQYVGPAPVPLAQYRSYMEAHGRADAHITRDEVRRAFSHLVLSDRVVDQLGPAIAARHSLFVYGPPGNGKTVISQAIRNLLVGALAVPHAIAVEGHIIRLFDPVNHEPIETEQPADALDHDDRDRRWVLCRRPMVTVGGELTLDALELGLAGTGFYRAPLQAVANGGVLVIDDFGRQHVAPRDLLNRWIVPLESRIDYLTLQSGQKFTLPFMALVIFATNIRPSDLVDEAFLRRIHYKVFAESPTVEEFHQIFENCCRERGLEFHPSLVGDLLVTYYEPRKIALRGCQPRDLIDQALSLADYRGEPRRLTRELIEAACAGYFVDERDDSAAQVGIGGAGTGERR